MTEEFLYYLWKFRLFNQFNLFSTSGEKIEILNVGELNTDSGPDFFNSKVKIGNTIWAGNVEIHINSSDWKKHKHNIDNSYDNLILHVVFNNDENIFRKNGELIPTIEISNQFDFELFENYKYLKNNNLWIPCQNSIANVNSIIINNWLNRLLIERLERKCISIYNSLSLNKNNWEETFYQHLASNFGFKINSHAFELLAKSLSQSYIAKHKDNLTQIEALLFGQSGMLSKEFIDEYPNKLKSEYKYLKNKFSLSPIEGHLWKFFRVRPSNFPTIRISQFANLIYKSSKLFSLILEIKNLNEIRNLLKVEPSVYWLAHFHFDKISPKRTKNISDSSIDLVLINTIIPFIFAYSKQKNDENLKERAINFYELIDGESNSIIQNWQSLRLNIDSAFNTQALLELKSQYCNNKKCLDCSIGNFILKKGVRSQEL